MTTLLSPYGAHTAELVGLYNKVKETSLTVQQFESNFNVGLPQRLDDPQGDRNTLIVITPRLQSVYIGNFNLKYNRIHIGELPEIVIDRPLDATHIYDVIDIINDKYGLNLTQNDVLNNTLTGVDSTPIVLEVSPMSIVYYGGAVIVNQGYYPFVDIEKQVMPIPADGLSLGQICDNTTLKDVRADGMGGMRTELVETNSLACGYIPTYVEPVYPPRGTALSYYCEGFKRMGVFADGIGGQEIAVIEENSPLCGYVP